jgi:hypothetical protein
METASPYVTPICAPSTSGTNSQNVLPVSTGPSLSTLNTNLPSNNSPEKVTPSRLLNINPVPKTPKKYSIAEQQLFCSQKRMNQEGNRVTEQSKV